MVFISLSASVELNPSAARNHLTYTSDPQMILLLSLLMAESAEGGLILSTTVPSVWDQKITD